MYVMETFDVQNSQSSCLYIPCAWILDVIEYSHTSCKPITTYNVQLNFSETMTSLLNIVYEQFSLMFFGDKRSFCSPGYPRPVCVAQMVLNHDSPASASLVLRLHLPMVYQLPHHPQEFSRLRFTARPLTQAIFEGGKAT